MKENCKTAWLFGTGIEYFPSASVRVPVVVPFIRTETPGIGLLSDELLTLPVMVFVRAQPVNLQIAGIQA